MAAAVGGSRAHAPRGLEALLLGHGLQLSIPELGQLRLQSLHRRHRCLLSLLSLLQRLHDCQIAGARRCGGPAAKFTVEDDSTCKTTAPGRRHGQLSSQKTRQIKRTGSHIRSALLPGRAGHCGDAPCANPAVGTQPWRSSEPMSSTKNARRSMRQPDAAKYVATALASTSAATARRRRSPPPPLPLLRASASRGGACAAA